MAAETLNPVAVVAATATGETRGRPEQDEEKMEEEEEQERQEQHWQQQQPAVLQELLLRACQDGQVPALQQLLHYDLIAMYQADALRLAEQLFIVCAENGSLECLRLLIRKFHHRLNINALDEDGTPCLHLAVLGQYVEMVEYLLRCGADVNARDSKQHTALHWAVVCQHHDIMTLLLVNGAEVDAQDDRGATPLHYAAHVCGKSAEQPGQDTALLLLQHLLYVKASPNCDDSDGRSPLLWAASAGSSTACKMLIAGGAPVDKVDKNGLSALHCAAARGQTAAVETLVLDNKASLDLRDRHGCPPLFYAISHCQLDCVRALLRLGANVGCVDARGRSAAHYSAESGSVDVVKELQAASCGYWSRSDGGELPVHTAIRRGKRDIAMLLLEEADAVSKGTLTECLHLAAGVNDAETISKLLEHFGVKINAVAKYKKTYMTALDIAYRKGFKECYQYIRKKGGRHAAGLVHASARKIQKVFRGCRRTAAADSSTQSSGQHSIAESGDVAEAPSGSDEVDLPTVADQTAAAAADSSTRASGKHSIAESGDVAEAPSGSDEVDLPTVADQTAATEAPSGSDEVDLPTVADQTAATDSPTSGKHSIPDSGDVAEAPSGSNEVDLPTVADEQETMDEQDRAAAAADETQAESSAASSSASSGDADTRQPVNSDADISAVAACSSGAADAADDPAQAAESNASRKDAGDEPTESSVRVDCSSSAEEADAEAQQAADETAERLAELDRSGSSDVDTVAMAPAAMQPPESTVEANCSGAADDGAAASQQASEAMPDHSLAAESGFESVAGPSELNVADGSELEGRLLIVQKDHVAASFDVSAVGQNDDESAATVIDEPRSDAQSSQDGTATHGVSRAADAYEDPSSPEELGSAIEAMPTVGGELVVKARRSSSSSRSSIISDNANSLTDAGRHGQLERDDLVDTSSGDEHDDVGSNSLSPQSLPSALPHVERDGDEGRVSQMTVVDSESHSVQPVNYVLNGAAGGYALSFIAPHPPDVPKPRAGHSGEEPLLTLPRRNHTIAFGAATTGAEVAQRLLTTRPHPTTALRRRSANRRPDTAGSAATRQAALSVSERIRYEVQQSVREYEEKRRAGTAFMKLLRLTRRAPTFNVITLLPSVPATVHYDSNLEFPAIVTRKNKMRNVKVPWQD